MTPVTPKVSQPETTTTRRVSHPVVTEASEPANSNKVVYMPPASNPLNTFMIFLLIGAAFVIGTLYSRVQGLEAQMGKGGLAQAPSGTGSAQVAPAGNAAAQQPPAAPQETFPTVQNVDPITDGDHINGNRNAEIVLIEYSDTDCPFCQRFHPTMLQLKTEYGDRLAWVYRHYPLPIHPRAEREAEATECVAELGGNTAFWTYLDKVLATANSTDTQLADLAAESGVNKANFQSCLTSGRNLAKVKAQTSSGQKAGVSGTPGTVAIVNGQQKMIPGAYPYEQIKQLIEQMLNS